MANAPSDALQRLIEVLEDRPCTVGQVQLCLRPFLSLLYVYDGIFRRLILLFICFYAFYEGLHALLLSMLLLPSASASLLLPSALLSRRGAASLAARASEERREAPRSPSSHAKAMAAAKSRSGSTYFFRNCIY